MTEEWKIIFGLMLIYFSFLLFPRGGRQRGLGRRQGRLSDRPAICRPSFFATLQRGNLFGGGGRRFGGRRRRLALDGRGLDGGAGVLADVGGGNAARERGIALGPTRLDR